VIGGINVRHAIMVPLIVKAARSDDAFQHFDRGGDEPVRAICRRPYQALYVRFIRSRHAVAAEGRRAWSCGRDVILCPRGAGCRGKPAPANPPSTIHGGGDCIFCHGLLDDGARRDHNDTPHCQPCHFRSADRRAVMFTRSERRALAAVRTVDIDIAVREIAGQTAPRLSLIRVPPRFRLRVH